MSYRFQKTYTLLPQSPLIHFQHEQKGATLRASEVKPKLDRYIIRRYQRENGAPVPKSWILEQSPDDQPALRYKLRITATGETELLELGRKTPYDIYFANMGEGNYKKGVWAKKTLTVNCMIDSLLREIARVIGDFFIAFNFGTMQDKGFGCYKVEGIEHTPSQIAKVLRDVYDCKKCYSVKGSDQKLLFKNIKVIHNTLKAGNAFSPKTNSLLFEYMRDTYHLSSEKDWLNKRAKQKPAYVRALLGVGEHMGPIDKPTTVSCENEAIARVPSPVFFVIYGDTAYFIGRKIPKEVLGAAFRFESESKKLASGRLQVPDESMIKSDFMDRFLAYAFIRFQRMSQERRIRFYVKEVR